MFLINYIIAFFFPKLKKEFIKKYLFNKAKKRFFNYTNIPSISEDKSFTDYQGKSLFWYLSEDKSTRISEFNTIYYYWFVFKKLIFCLIKRKK